MKVLTVLIGIFASQVLQVNGNDCPIALVEDEVSWVLNLQRSSGSIMQNVRDTLNTSLNPYQANLALTNILRVNTSSSTLSKVNLYMNWYINHLNAKDKWNLTGTIYDYYLNENEDEISKNDVDSTDSYAATFLTLVKEYLDASGDRRWVRNRLGTLKQIADAIWGTYNPDLHLTYAKPDYKEALLMDNVEVWRGLEDYSRILANMDDPDFEHYHYRAELIRNGIENNLWNPDRKEYQFAYKKPPRAIEWGTFYPDTTANLWPMIFKLPEALLYDRRHAIYTKFKDNHIEKWTNLQSDPFPWCCISEVVKLNERNDESSNILGTFRRNIMNKYYPNRQYTWIDGESSWFSILLMDNDCSDFS